MKSFSPHKFIAKLILVLTYLVLTFVMLRIVGPSLISAASTGLVVFGFGILIFWLIVSLWIALTLVTRYVRNKKQKEA